MDREDRRVKDLTEGLLYEFLPAALAAVLPPCEDPLAELGPERCGAVAGVFLSWRSMLGGTCVC